MLTALLLLGPSLQAAQAADPVHPDLADLTARWESALQEFGALGMAMVLVEGDEVVHRVTLGRRDPERDLPVTPDTVFYIASTTKPYVAFALAQLAERGKVELDAPVRRYLPRFRLADEALSASITVRDLLCHRHGLNSGPIVLLDAYTGEITEERYYHFLSEVVPAGGVAYSNLHFTLAGRVVEAVSGRSWRDYLAEELFAPAGMTRTTGYADRMYALEDVAVPAVLAGGRAVAAPVRKTDRTMHAAGGLGTSIDDLARWLRLQLNGGLAGEARLIAEEGLAATWELQSRSTADADFGPTEGFGLGWQRGSYRGHLELRHGGGYVGAASYACFLPELGLGLGILASGDLGAQALLRLVSTDVHERLLADDEVQDPLPELLRRTRSDRERFRRQEAEAAAAAERLPELSLPPASYHGTYRNEHFGALTIGGQGERLRARLGELELTALADERDVLRLVSRGALEAVARFELDGGAVVAVALDLAGPVRFER
jgi:CubicO group peptidase (beta-lactamase class C family)